MNDAASSSASASLAARLRAFLVAHFSRNELELLCLDLHVDPEDVPGIGAGKEYWAAQIVLYFQRRDALPELIRRCKELRPGVPWDELNKVDVSPLKSTAPISARSTSAESRSPSVESTLSKSKTDHRRLAIAQKMNFMHQGTDRIGNAIKSLEEVMAFFREIDHKNGQINCLESIAELYLLMGSVDKALAAYQEILEL